MCYNEDTPPPPSNGLGNLSRKEVPLMFSLSCVSRSSGFAVWSRFGLSAAEVMRLIPSLDCGAEYIVRRGSRVWVIYHGSRSRECRREG